MSLTKTLLQVWAGFLVFLLLSVGAAFGIGVIIGAFVRGVAWAAGLR